MIVTRFIEFYCSSFLSLSLSFSRISYSGWFIPPLEPRRRSSVWTKHHLVWLYTFFLSIVIVIMMISSNFQHKYQCGCGVGVTKLQADGTKEKKKTKEKRTCSWIMKSTILWQRFRLRIKELPCMRVDLFWCLEHLLGASFWCWFLFVVCLFVRLHMIDKFKIFQLKREMENLSNVPKYKHFILLNIKDTNNFLLCAADILNENPTRCKWHFLKDQLEILPTMKHGYELKWCHTVT